MRILCKYKDYYDFADSGYHANDDLVFDRRNCILYSVQSLFETYATANSGKQIYPCIFLVLEAGFRQYLFLVSGISRGSSGTISGNFDLVLDIDLGRHFSSSPMEFFHIGLHRHTLDLEFNRERVSGVTPDEVFESLAKWSRRYNKPPVPILRDTFIPSFISPEVMYRNLDTYLSSLRGDKTAVDTRSDIQKSIDHGFDSRMSFRHPVS